MPIYTRFLERQRWIFHFLKFLFIFFFIWKKIFYRIFKFLQMFLFYFFYVFVLLLSLHGVSRRRRCHGDDRKARMHFPRPRHFLFRRLSQSGDPTLDYCCCVTHIILSSISEIPVSISPTRSWDARELARFFLCLSIFSSISFRVLTGAGSMAIVIGRVARWESGWSVWTAALFYCFKNNCFFLFI